MLTAAGTPLASARVDAVPGQHEPLGSGSRLAVGKPSSRPRRSPLTTVAAQLERVAEQRARRAPTSPAAISERIRLEETISPSTSRSGTTRAPKRPSAASSAASPCAPAPKRKFSPTETSRAPSRSTSTSVDELLRRAARANAASKRTTISSSTPSEAIRSALTGSGVSSSRRARGRDRPSSGCGSKVSDRVGAARSRRGARRGRRRRCRPRASAPPGAASVSSTRRMRREA